MPRSSSHFADDLADEQYKSCLRGGEWTRESGWPTPEFPGLEFPLCKFPKSFIFGWPPRGVWLAAPMRPLWGSFVRKRR